MEQSRTHSSLDGSVLVLNRFYMAVHVVSVRRALVILYRELAEVIHVEDGQYYNYDFESWLEVSEFTSAEEDHRSENDDWIRSVNFAILVPRVIRLNCYDKVPKLTLRFNRRNLFARDKNTCQYCSRQLALRHLSLDHVIPRCHGGKTSWENVVCCCLKCNGRKGDQFPEDAGMKLIQKPKRPQQSPVLTVKLGNPKYEVWRIFLKGNSLSLDA